MRAGSLSPDSNQSEGRVQISTSESIPPHPSIRLCTSAVGPRKTIIKASRNNRTQCSCFPEHTDTHITVALGLGLSLGWKWPRRKAKGQGGKGKQN